MHFLTSALVSLIMLTSYAVKAQTLDKYIDDSKLGDCCSFKFFYVKAGAGYELPNENLNLRSQNVDLDFGIKRDIPSYMLGIGYDFGQPRLELEGHLGIMELTDLSLNKLNMEEVEHLNESLSYEGSPIQFKVVTNIIYDFFDEYTLFQPYVGLGGGITFFTSDTDVMTTMTDMDEMMDMEDDPAMKETLFTIDGLIKPQPIAHAIVGFNINTNDYVFIDASYKFLSTYRYTIHDATTVYQGSEGELADVSTSDYRFQNHIFVLGVRIPIRSN